MKKLWQVLLIFMYIIVGVFALLAIFVKFEIGGIRMFNVKSGSMEPAIKTASLVLTKRESIYQKNDIISFWNKESPPKSVTHRVYSVEQNNNARVYITKGDANAAPDSEVVDEKDVIGKVRVAIPYLGYLGEFAKSLSGLIIFILIPALIIIIEEILKIKDEAKKIGKQRREKRVKAQEEKIIIDERAWEKKTPQKRIMDIQRKD